MAYLALYREWRPRRFADMVGQEHVKRTFLNALQQNKIAHAYLFSGPRGTGKTTAAKILAKALNCEEPDGVEPCNRCSSCQSIDQGMAMEVLEIDAASNRGIDEMRDLRDKVKLSVAPGKHKVYIIDEVHMLTSEAFNALLKTLEEPPGRVVFVLATTEVQKIPLTILSRVQRFEFHRIATEDIEERLTEVCHSLGRQVETGALRVIAQKSEGGLRDALSILDQCLLLDDPVGVEHVYQVLGMAGDEFNALLVDALAAADYGTALARLGEGIRQGQDPRQILRELLDYLRQMLLYAATGQPPLVAPHLHEKLGHQCRSIGMRQLLRWIGIMLQGEGQLRFAGNARLAVELLLVQVIGSGRGEAALDAGIGERLQQIEQDIRQLQGSAPAFSPVSGHHNGAGGRGGELPTGLATGIRGSAAANKDSGRAAGVGQTSGSGDTPGSGLGQEVASGDIGEGASKAPVIEQLQAAWPQILENVRKAKRSTHAFLLEGKPVKLEGNTLTLVFRAGCSFHRDKVNQIENRQTIEDVLLGMFGRKFSLQNLIENELAAAEGPSREEVVVQKAREIFGAGLVVVKDE